MRTLGIIIIVAILLIATLRQCHYEEVKNITFADNSHYTGSLNKDGKLHGHGRLEWGNGSYYQGQFKQGLMHGRGIHAFHNNYFFLGEFADGDAEGLGKIYYPSGEIYLGQVSDYLENGFGKMIYRNGNMYIGEFIKGDMTGKGRWHLTNGNIYLGDVIGGNFHGNGKLSYANKDFYIGQFKQGDFAGIGRYETSGGDIYEGQFQSGVLHGKGRVTFADGSVLQGQFENWSLHGLGASTDAKGNQYLGKYENGYLVSGRYIGINGEEYVGQFEYNQYSGLGELTNLNGDVYKGKFEYGNPEGFGTLVLKKPLDGVKELSGQWEQGQLVQADQFDIYKAGQLAEFFLYQQASLLKSQLGQLSQNDPDKIDLYTLGVAAYGKQEVFRREINYLEKMLSTQVSEQAQRSIFLANSRRSMGDRPLATLTSLEQSLNMIAEKMDKQQDILFLYMTSHGSKDHKLLFNQPGLSLPDLSAEKLASLLKETEIKWKVIVISACYSGGFIEPLKDDHTLIFTASAADKTSFGCVDNNQFTYFGEAFLKEALSPKTSFVRAFNQAVKEVKQKEITQKLTHSEPQSHQPSKIIDYLKSLDR